MDRFIAFAKAQIEAGATGAMRRNKLIAFHGHARAMKEWADCLGLPATTIYNRMTCRVFRARNMEPRRPSLPNPMMRRFLKFARMLPSVIGEPLVIRFAGARFFSIDLSGQTTGPSQSALTH